MEVAIVSGRRWALMHELRGEDEPRWTRSCHGSRRPTSCWSRATSARHRKIETRAAGGQGT